MTTRCFPDVNVWFALAVGEHPHHGTAAAWWAEESAVAGFARVTELGLLRLLTTAAAMGGRPRTNREAWGVYDQFFSDTRVRRFPELPALDVHFRSLTDLAQASSKLWVDAYLAAYATANDATLVTFDKAFRSYGVRSRILT